MICLLTQVSMYCVCVFVRACVRSFVRPSVLACVPACATYLVTLLEGVVTISRNGTERAERVG